MPIIVGDSVGSSIGAPGNDLLAHRADHGVGHVAARLDPAAGLADAILGDQQVAIERKHDGRAVFCGEFHDGPFNRSMTAPMIVEGAPLPSRVMACAIVSSGAPNCKAIDNRIAPSRAIASASLPVFAPVMNTSPTSRVPQP